MKDILLVSDNNALVQNLHTILTFLGESCRSFSVSEASEQLTELSPTAVLLDIASGEQALALVKTFPMHPFVAINVDDQPTPTVGNLVGHVSLPITYPVLTQAIHRCQEYIRSHPVRNSAVPMKTRLFRSLVGKSEQIQLVRRLVEQVAPTDATVLILGESGTGKEVVARNVHFLSERKDGPFIPVN